MSAGDINSIAEFAAREKIDQVIVGPEQPLVDGVADALVGRGVAVFGPSRALEEATRAYEAVGKIRFDGMQFRHDIGAAS